MLLCTHDELKFWDSPFITCMSDKCPSWDIDLDSIDNDTVPSTILAEKHPYIGCLILARVLDGEKG